jgi:hypothetical protein
MKETVIRLVLTEKDHSSSLAVRSQPALQSDTDATKPTTGNLDPFPAVRVECGRSDLGLSRVQLRPGRQLDA